MLLSKNQMRPRRKRFRFSNSEILSLDTTGIFPLIALPGLGVGFAMQEVQFLSNIVVAYNTIDATNPFMFLFDTFGISTLIEDIATSFVQNFSALFGQTGLNLLNAPAPKLVIDDSATFTEVGPGGGLNYTDFPDLLANGGMGLVFSNGGVDLGGGDPANYLDIFLKYNIVNL